MPTLGRNSSVRLIGPLMAHALVRAPSTLARTTIQREPSVGTGADAARTRATPHRSKVEPKAHLHVDLPRIGVVLCGKLPLQRPGGIGHPRLHQAQRGAARIKP